jgi:hypothetical protein
MEATPPIGPTLPRRRLRRRSSNTSNIQVAPPEINLHNSRCPVCNIELDIFEIFTHIYTNHDEFLAAWSTIAFPQLDVDNIHDIAATLQNLGINAEMNLNYANPYLAAPEVDAFDQLSYEQLSAICDEIGYHKVGIKDIDAVAPAIVRTKKEDASSEETKCPICLEDMYKAVYMRSINGCGHEFCGGCIEEWLHENKNCPICKFQLHNPDEERVLSTTDSLPDLIETV